MIRVERGPMQRAGLFAYRVAGAFACAGKSRQPLLDACRRVKSMGADPGAQIGLFHEGGEAADLVTTVGHGAKVTIDESGPKFKKWKVFEAF